MVHLDKIEDGMLHVGNLDILDGTPLLDIKPYVPKFDAQTNGRTGRLKTSGESVRDRRSDDRFK